MPERKVHMSITDEAARCLKCKTARCQKSCPVSTPIPQIMNLFEEGKIKEAGKILFENNPMTAVCSIICPHERNCAGNCILGIKGKPVEFFRIEQYVSGFFLETYEAKKPEQNGFRVAVVGAGPAGITMSIILAQKGFSVTLIEARDKIGGVLRFGIPEFRLPKKIIDKYADILFGLGVKFKPNTFVGSNVTVGDMFIDGYDAVFLAVGTSRPNRLGLLGETLGNVHYAVDYLKSPDTYRLGERVVVVGAGNVALDAARVAVRQGADEVIILNSRRECDMTGNNEEIRMAEVDGVKFIHLKQAVKLEEDGVVCFGVKVTENGDGAAEYDEDFTDSEKIAADSIIVAIGQGPQAAVLADTKNVGRTSRGLFEVDENGKTDQPGVFAAGDVVSGPKTVVEAVAFTKKVAEEIESYCRSKGEKR